MIQLPKQLLGILGLSGVLADFFGPAPRMLPISEVIYPVFLPKEYHEVVRAVELGEVGGGNAVLHGFIEFLLF